MVKWGCFLKLVHLTWNDPFVLLSVYLRIDLSDPVFVGVGLAGFETSGNAFFLAYSWILFCLLLFSLSLLEFYGLVLWGWVFGPNGC